MPRFKTRSVAVWTWASNFNLCPQSHTGSHTIKLSISHTHTNSHPVTHIHYPWSKKLTCDVKHLCSGINTKIDDTQLLRETVHAIAHTVTYYIRSHILSSLLIQIHTCIEKMDTGTQSHLLSQTLLYPQRQVIKHNHTHSHSDTHNVTPASLTNPYTVTIIPAENRHTQFCTWDTELHISTHAVTDKITFCHTAASHIVIRNPRGTHPGPIPVPAGPPQARPWPPAPALSQAQLTSPRRRGFWKPAQRLETRDVPSQNPPRGEAEQGLKRAGPRARLGKHPTGLDAAPLFLKTLRTTSPRTLCAGAAFAELHFPEGPKAHLYSAPAHAAAAEGVWGESCVPPSPVVLGHSSDRGYLFVRKPWSSARPWLLLNAQVWRSVCDRRCTVLCLSTPGQSCQCSELLYLKSRPVIVGRCVTPRMWVCVDLWEGLWLTLGDHFFVLLPQRSKEFTCDTRWGFFVSGLAFSVEPMGEVSLCACLCVWLSPDLTVLPPLCHPSPPALGRVTVTFIFISFLYLDLMWYHRRVIRFR